jgi:type I restriction enzyme S subunit
MTLMALGDTARFINGAAFKPTDWEEEGLPIIRIQNLTGTGEKFNLTTRTVKPELIVEPGDLLVSWSATLDVYRWVGPRGVLNQHIFKVLPNSDIDPEYLFFALKNALAELSSKTHGSTMKHVVRGDFESTQVNVPQIAEQRRIVDLLSRAEGIVRLRREAEKKAAELIPALFLDMFGNPATNPKGWRTCSLDTVLSETKLGLVRGAKEMDGQNPFPYVRMDAVGGGSVRVSALKRVDATEKEIGEYSLRYGDFLFNTRNSKELVGKTGMFKGGNESVYLFNNNLMRMRFDGTSLLPEYVNALFQTSYIQKQLEAIKRGTTSVFAIYYKDLRHIELRLPDLKLQQEFAERFVQIDSIKVQQSAATAKAQTAFDALLAQTFT